MPEGSPTVHVLQAAKPWWTSRTLIVNAVALALLAAESQLQLLQSVVPVNVYALLAFALPVLNAGLRLVTTMPVQVRAADATTISPAPGWPELPTPAGPAAPAAPVPQATQNHQDTP